MYIKNRRVKKVSVYAGFLVSLLITGTKHDGLDIISGVPEDAVLEYSDFDYVNNCVNFYYSSEKFDPIAEGAAIPSFDIHAKQG